VIRATVWAWLTSALLLGACTPLVPPVALPAPADDVNLYVIERGWHADISFPVDEMTGPLTGPAQRFAGVRFPIFGFGERQFLLARLATLGGMLSAMLPSRSALLMTALDGTPQAAFGADHVVVVHLSRAGLARIEAAAWEEIDKKPAGELNDLGDGPYPGSVYYAALGTYDAIDTCNTWTAEMLRTGGMPVQVAGVLFVGQVMEMARSIAAQQASMRHN
jgi:Protein of unknown function (DUF2459)